MGVGVGRDDEHALSRLRHEQRSVDHYRAEAVAGVAIASQIVSKSLPPCDVSMPADVFDHDQAWRPALGAKPRMSLQNGQNAPERAPSAPCVCRPGRRPGKGATPRRGLRRRADRRRQGAHVADHEALGEPKLAA